MKQPSGGSVSGFACTGVPGQPVVGNLAGVRVCRIFDVSHMAVGIKEVGSAVVPGRNRFAFAVFSVIGPVSTAVVNISPTAVVSHVNCVSGTFYPGTVGGIINLIALAVKIAVEPYGDIKFAFNGGAADGHTVTVGFDKTAGRSRSGRTGELVDNNFFVVVKPYTGKIF